MKSKTLKQRRQKLIKGLPDLAEIIRGSVVKRYLHCGKSECRCHQGPGHGPYNYLLTTLAPGKTRTVLLSADQLRAVRRWVKNFGELKKGLEKIVEINTRLLQLDRQSKTAKIQTGKKRVKG
jgi:Family of unknown function (DUF6788)